MEILKEAIEKTIPKEKKLELLQEQKEGLIVEMEKRGCKHSKSEIGAILDKLFADKLDLN